MGGEKGISRALQSSVRNTRSWRNKTNQTNKQKRLRFIKRKAEDSTLRSLGLIQFWWSGVSVETGRAKSRDSVPVDAP